MLHLLTVKDLHFNVDHLVAEKLARIPSHELNGSLSSWCIIAWSTLEIPRISAKCQTIAVQTALLQNWIKPWCDMIPHVPTCHMKGGWTNITARGQLWSPWEVAGPSACSSHRFFLTLHHTCCRKTLRRQTLTPAQEWSCTQSWTGPLVRSALSDV